MSNTATAAVIKSEVQDACREYRRSLRACRKVGLKIDSVHFRGSSDYSAARRAALKDLRDAHLRHHRAMVTYTRLVGDPPSWYFTDYSLGGRLLAPGEITPTTFAALIICIVLPMFLFLS